MSPQASSETAVTIRNAVSTSSGDGGIGPHGVEVVELAHRICLHLGGEHIGLLHLQLADGLGHGLHHEVSALADVADYRSPHLGKIIGADQRAHRAVKQGLGVELR